MEIDSNELKELMIKKHLNLIDIRDHYSYSNGTIDGAVNIPYQELILSFNQYLKKGECYYLFCQHGSNSRMLRDFLSRRGFLVININGGYQGYKDSH